MKVSVVGLCACALALAVGAPAASATTVHDEHRVCTANARWQLTFGVFGNGVADVTYSNIVCDGRVTSFESDGARLVAEPSAPVSSTGFLRLTVDGLLTVAGTSNGTLRQDDLGLRGAVSVTSSDLKAAFATNYTAADGTRVVKKTEFQSTGTCGTLCYDTDVLNVATEERVS